MQGSQWQRTGNKNTLLLDNLKRSTVLNWNKEGEFSYRGQRIPSSSIIDLMADIMRHKKSPPTRWAAGICSSIERGYYAYRYALDLLCEI